MNFTLWAVLGAFVLGLLTGGYCVTHLDETLRGAGELRAYAVRQLHHEPTCPEGWTCTKQSMQPVSPTP